MALSSRLLSKSKLLYGSQLLLQKEFAVPVRHFAKGSAPPALKGDEMLKEKITIAPEDPAAVSHYANVMKTVRQKANLLSESQDIQATIDLETQDIPDARTYLLTLKEIRTKRGLTDDLGAEAMIGALDKIEKELKKPLLRNDKKGMDLLLAEFDKINQKSSSPDELPFDGRDYNHWLIVLKFPRRNKPPPNDMVRFYEETCARGLNISVEEAKKKMYACSTTQYTGFQAVMTEEESKNFEGLPGVIFVLPDSYIDSMKKEYGGDKYIDGTIIPRFPPVQ